MSDGPFKVAPTGLSSLLGIMKFVWNINGRRISWENQLTDLYQTHLNIVRVVSCVLGIIF